MHSILCSDLERLGLVCSENYKRKWWSLERAPYFWTKFVDRNQNKGIKTPAEIGRTIILHSAPVDILFVQSKVFYEWSWCSGENMSQSILFQLVFMECSYGLWIKWTHRNTQDVPCNGFLKVFRIQMMISLKQVMITLDCFAFSPSSFQIS